MSCSPMRSRECPWVSDLSVHVNMSVRKCANCPARVLLKVAFNATTKTALKTDVHTYDFPFSFTRR
jgi:hypothetical protein